MDLVRHLGRRRVNLTSVAGAVATLVSYTSGFQGGHYVIFWDAIVFGLLRFLAVMIDRKLPFGRPVGQCSHRGQTTLLLTSNSGQPIDRVCEDCFYALKP
jgi:hypothetical protein